MGLLTILLVYGIIDNLTYFNVEYHVLCLYLTLCTNSFVKNIKSSSSVSQIETFHERPLIVSQHCAPCQKHYIVPTRKYGL
jgi:methyl coenzyme M reductase alpha subunit